MKKIRDVIDYLSTGEVFFLLGMVAIIWFLFWLIKRDDDRHDKKYGKGL